jgi:hypothetical protein
MEREGVLGGSSALFLLVPFFEMVMKEVVVFAVEVVQAERRSIWVMRCLIPPPWLVLFLSMIGKGTEREREKKKRECVVVVFLFFAKARGVLIRRMFEREVGTINI